MAQKITASQRAAFLASKPVEVIIAGTKHYAAPREFSTGGVGYGLTAKQPVLLDDGSVINMQISFNPAIIGSKPE